MKLEIPRKEEVIERLLKFDEIVTGVESYKTKPPKKAPKKAWGSHANIVQNGMKLFTKLDEKIVGEYTFCVLSVVNIHINSWRMKEIPFERIEKVLKKIEREIRAVFKIEGKYGLHLRFEMFKNGPSFQQS